jgi:hypothetical protein
LGTDDDLMRSLCRNGLTVCGVSLRPAFDRIAVDDAFAIPGMIATTE